MTTCIRILRRVIWGWTSGRSYVRMRCSAPSSHRYFGQLNGRNVVREYWDYLVRVAVPDSSAHPWKKTLDGQEPKERLCCSDSHTGRSLEAAHNCRVLVVTVAAAVAHR